MKSRSCPEEQGKATVADGTACPSSPRSPPLSAVTGCGHPRHVPSAECAVPLQPLPMGGTPPVTAMTEGEFKARIPTPHAKAGQGCCRGLGHQTKPLSGHPCQALPGHPCQAIPGMTVGHRELLFRVRTCFFLFKAC